jgi:hypothetical protein
VRRLGLVLLAAALAGFLFASAQKRRYAAAALADAETVSSETMAAARWESARWLLVGMGVIGVVFTVLPGKRAS